MTLLAAAGVSNAWIAFVLIHIGMVPFVMAHWEEYHTGTLILGPIANPTEGNVACTCLCMHECSSHDVRC